MIAIYFTLLLWALTCSAVLALYFRHRDQKCPLCRTRHDPAHCPREYVEPLLKNLNKLH